MTGAGARFWWRPTEIRAPADGAINNLTVRVGDAARAEEPLIGIVDASAWLNGRHGDYECCLLWEYLLPWPAIDGGGD